MDFISGVSSTELIVVAWSAMVKRMLRQHLGLGGESSVID